MLVNQVHGLVSVIFPEFLMVMKDIKTKTAHLSSETLSKTTGYRGAWI